MLSPKLRFLNKSPNKWDSSGHRGHKYTEHSEQVTNTDKSRKQSKGFCRAKSARLCAMEISIYVRDAITDSLTKERVKRPPSVSATQLYFARDTLAMGD